MARPMFFSDRDEVQSLATRVLHCARHLLPWRHPNRTSMGWVAGDSVAVIAAFYGERLL